MAWTSRELVSTALKGGACPRIPTGPLAVHFCAVQAGVSLRRYTENAQTLADCIIRTWEKYRPDAVWVSADTWVTAQAMGARAGFTSEDQPMAGMGGPLIRTAADID